MSRRAGEKAQLKSGGVEMGDQAELGLQGFTSQAEIHLSPALSLLDARNTTPDQKKSDQAQVGLLR